MFIKKFNLKSATLALSLFAVLSSSAMFAEEENKACCGRGGRGNRQQGSRVVAAQANYQSETAFAPVSDQPIPFPVRNFRTNFGVNADNSVFEVEVPGLYSIDSFLLLNVPAVGDVVNGYITINGRRLLTFFEQEVRESVGSPVVNFHFNDRLVYLRRGDQVSVVLSSFTAGTSILASGFVIVALNNSN